MSASIVDDTVSRIYSPGKWDLSDLLPDASEETLSARLAELENRVQVVEARRSALAPAMSPSLLMTILHEYESTIRTAEKLRCFGSLSFSANTQDGAVLAMQGRTEQAYADALSRIKFVTLWWQSLDEAEAEALLNPSAIDGEYRHFLKEQRRIKRYSLGEEAERIIGLKNANGIDAMARLHQMHTSSLRYSVLIDGEMRLLTQSEIYPYRFSPSAQLRQDVFQEESRVAKQAAPLLAQMLVNRVNDWHTEMVVLRGYSTPMNARTVADDFSDDVVALQMETVRANCTVFQRYLRVKTRLLGMERLRESDVLAPLSDRQVAYPYAEAIPLILEAFADFDAQVGLLAQRVFDENHIDAEMRDEKETGLFSMWSGPEDTPWILMSYSGMLEDVIDLAHELGHAVQNMLCSHHHMLTHFPLSIPVAEVSSLFAEQLIIHKMLSATRENADRVALLGSVLDRVCSYAYLAMNGFFEKAAHEAVLAGQSVEEVDRLYHASHCELYGDAVEVDDEGRHRWVRVLHYHLSPFYMYAYSFATLIALALYRRVETEGAPARRAVLEIMAAGGSERPETILREAGIDIRDPAFWQSGFDVINNMIDELEVLV